MSKKSSPLSIADFFRSFVSYRAFYTLGADQRSIVFYSESGQDWHVFRRIIEKLLSESKNVCYVTSDRQDPGLSMKKQGYHPFFIKEGFWQILFFQFLKADVLVLTMIDLNMFQLKRSINPVHYIYIFHAMGSTHMVDFETSYDHYDTILCSGPHQIREIRRREELKSLTKKNLVEHGYGRLEELMELSSKQRKTVSDPPVILLAPTWGESSILNLCGRQLVSTLLAAGYRVILRPHYQTRKLTPHVIDEILRDNRGYTKLSHVEKMGDTDSLLDSDLLICDWSSTSIEYALGLEKPVLYIDVPRRVRNEKYMELGLEPMEVTIRNEVGMVLDPKHLDRAPQMVESLLADPEKFRARIAALRKRVVFNVGTSVETGAAAIKKIAASVAEKRHSSSKP